jgi:hypothetical protein
MAYWGVEYNSDLFEAQTIERLLSHFQCLLEEVWVRHTFEIELAYVKYLRNL